jgi:hypothetical protein
MESMRFFDRRKFLWDGEVYDSTAAAGEKQREYESQGFETRLVAEEGKAFVFTRRVVKEIVLEGEGG